MVVTLNEWWCQSVGTLSFCVKTETGLDAETSYIIFIQILDSAEGECAQTRCVRLWYLLTYATVAVSYIKASSVVSLRDMQ